MQGSFYVIGGMNVDRKLSSFSDYLEETSNPVHMTQSVGGVARNVAENLGRLGMPCVLLSMWGKDGDAYYLKKQTSSFVDCSQITEHAYLPTSTYIAVLEKNGNLKTAYACMDICEEMDAAWLKPQLEQIKPYDVVVADLNLPQSSLELLLSEQQKKQFFLSFIPVSVAKMSKMPASLKGLSLLVVNQLETETYLHLSIKTEEDLLMAAKAWKARGVDTVVITQGGKKLCCLSEKEELMLVPPYLEKMVDATGAGDAFCATLLAALFNQNTLKESLLLAMTNAYHTLQTEQTVRSDVDFQKLIKERGILYGNKIF